MATKPTINPAALTPGELASALSKAGAQITEEQVKQDLAEGAPTNADGTLHLVHYAAWLAGQVK
jgi:hypothetical protein